MYDNTYPSLPPQQLQQRRPSSPNNNYRPLNVVDALAYLDQVKGRFSDKPNVYNQFLDIMKDFKSQAIDTPGVIERVSNLFRGHPTLISGFNTFLPVGYRIECSVDNTTVITTSPYNEKRPLEFNHAINYVNRIKTRFTHQPEIYKQFLEVLQTYQKDLKTIHEVYANIQYLFAGHDDLLEEFKQFLPEVQESRGFKRVMQTQAMPVTKKSKQHQLQQQQQQQQQQPSLRPQQRDPPFDPLKPSVSTEETELFDRIKKYIGNKPSHDEFLKIIHLYTLHILDADQLIQHVEPFLDQELLDAFKHVLGYEPKEKTIEKPSYSAVKPDLNHCEAVEESPSYRIVPKEWQNQPCSGRDQLCWEVLNDEYVSHPRWASEDSGFTASKKNPYEEAMHRCEEERYDFDLNIEANLNIIALLEPIAQRIEAMTDEEKDMFQLKPGLGGQTVSIYERIIKKIYDRETAMEILDLIYSRPAAVVPVLLKRLKQKDEEWKRIQREWNKQWREQDSKNFYKSLDYQGNTFKSNDRKSLSVKAMMAEVEQHKQFKFEPSDCTVIKDMVRLVLFYLRRQNGFTKRDKRKIRSFLCTFIPNFFQFDQDLLTREQFVYFTDDEEEGPSEEEQTDEEHQEELLIPKDDEIKDKADQQVDVQTEIMKLTCPRCDIKDNSSDGHFLCNIHVYCFFRLFQILYERLHKLKSLSDENPRRLQKKLNLTAVELDLYSNRYDDIDLSKGCYHALLEHIEKFLDNEIDQATFEENARYIFGIDAYITFTIDKVLHFFIKQVCDR
ncbi:hypothetical protein BCV71DRAFT_176005 [Rhizopus microsporus]|uniref:Histone deacetylase interacting domain-containing protein n=1 Tax=Rhizopus microsporus TaxID=58291 RepID=A0A1X0S7P1_RHIZD|nr:hypothetical protein BCV71DRAFT_176005 [Rhizopus microsporus]